MSCRFGDFNPNTKCSALYGVSESSDVKFIQFDTPLICYQLYMLSIFMKTSIL